MSTECLCKCFQKWGLIRELIGPPSLEWGMLQKSTWYTVISNTECFSYQLVSCIYLMLLWFIIAMILSSASHTSCWARLSWKASIVAADRCPLWELGLSVGWDSTQLWLLPCFRTFSLCCSLLHSCCALCTLHTGLCSCVGVLGQLFKHHIVKHIRKGTCFIWKNFSMVQSKTILFAYSSCDNSNGHVIWGYCS